MAVKRRYRLVSPGTWQDGLEFFAVIALCFFSHFVATQWVLPVIVFPCVFLHLLQLFAFLVLPEPKIEWTLITLLMDICAFGSQYLVNFGYIGSELRMDSLIKADSNGINWAKLGFTGGLLFINLVRIWQFYDMDNDVEEADDTPQKPVQRRVALVPLHATASHAARWQS